MGKCMHDYIKRLMVMSRDGSVSLNTRGQYRVSFVGPRSFLESLQLMIQKLAQVRGGCITTKGRIADLCFTGNVVSRSILSTLYKNSVSDTRLSRKYDIYQQILKKVDPNTKAWRGNCYTDEYSDEPILN